jgi:hypothetical protein
VTDCTPIQLDFPGFKRRKVQADFSGGHVSSDAGGCLLLRQVDNHSGLLKQVSQSLTDFRRKKSCAHDLTSLLRQRVYGLALGYEDVNDHDPLRHDLALQTAIEKDSALASASTLCRLENRSDRDTGWAIHRVIVDGFVASFKRAPSKLILDFDATDDKVHGKQEGRFFHGYYDSYCFLPLYVFCGEQLLVSYLRSSKIDGAKHTGAILSLLVKRLRHAWPKVKIIFRGDSGFCRHKMLSWCERNDVNYVVGLAKNKRLNTFSYELQQQAEEQFQKTGNKQRLFCEFRYAAKSWNRKRRVIAKAEHTDKGSNPRYIVTNLDGDPQELYDKLYCARGDMENRIKEQQLDLFADRTSCHNWWANQFRLLLASLAYTLLETIRRVALPGTEMAKAQCNTIRLKLLKVGGVIVKNTRRIRFLLSSAYPYQKLFQHVTEKLNST